MKIRMLQGHNQPPEAAHIHVVIDVIRAFTVAHYAFLSGAQGIIPVATVDEALELKNVNPDFILAGEIKGLLIPGFELDNSPVRLQQFDLKGKFLIQKTTNGVTAALNALNAEHVLVTGFSNARTTAEFIKDRWLRDEETTINITASHPSGDDDLACAEYIADLLQRSDRVTPEVTIQRIRASEAANKFYDNAQPEFLEEDLSLCTQEVPSDFVMKVKIRNGMPLIEKVKAGSIHADVR
ncbi:2-phosphosulfolactate phosphatase [Paenibacillus lactis]|uniref:2-phosphosulfolactate phosphatase n=1 Tax=Paenibacillus lactis TaxID=228574 RepID=UPI0036B0AB30